MTPERGRATQRHRAEHTSLLEGHHMLRLERCSMSADDVRYLWFDTLTRTGVSRHSLALLPRQEL